MTAQPFKIPKELPYKNRIEEGQSGKPIRKRNP